MWHFVQMYRKLYYWLAFGSFQWVIDSGQSKPQTAHCNIVQTHCFEVTIPHLPRLFDSQAMCESVFSGLSNSKHHFCGIPSAYTAFKMTGSSSAVNRDDPRASPRPSPRAKTGSFRKGKGEPIERKDTDSIGSDTRSRSGSLSSVDSSDQLQEGRGKFEKVSFILICWHPVCSRGN